MVAKIITHLIITLWKCSFLLSLMFHLSVKTYSFGYVKWYEIVNLRMHGGVSLHGVIIWLVYKGTISFTLTVPLFGHDLSSTIN